MSEQEYYVGDGWVCHTPDPNQYHDTSQIHLSTMGGRSLGNALSGRFGIRGVVLPRATVRGGSRYKGIFKVGLVNIDPHMPGEGALKVDLSEVTEEQLEEIMNDMSESSEDFRDMAYKTFSKLANSKKVIASEESMPTSSPANLPNSTNIPRSTSFSKSKFKTSEEGAEDVARTKAPLVKPIVAEIDVPTYRVTFELDGFGTIETSYHNVIKGEDGISLVLIYDNRFKGGTKYFPPISDNELYVDVHHLPVLFKVKSSGLRYRIDELEHYIMLIEEAVAKEDEATSYGQA